MDSLGFKIFLLLAFLIAAVYYVGVSTDFATFSNGSRTLIYALTGRDKSGAFAGYPSGNLPTGVLN